MNAPFLICFFTFCIALECLKLFFPVLHHSHSIIQTAKSIDCAPQLIEGDCFLMLGIFFFSGTIGIATRKFKHLFQTFDILLFFILVTFQKIETTKLLRTMILAY